VLAIEDMEQADAAIEDTTKAIKRDFRYVKARLYVHYAYIIQYV